MAREIQIASTIGPIDAGILEALEAAFAKKTGIQVKHVGAGTGEALKLGRTGAFDLVLVHAKALEEQFVTQGFGTARLALMYNDFVLVGPAADPARLQGLPTATAALERIRETKSLFISRGDNSGTHVKEKELWQAAGLTPAGTWYQVYDKGAAGNVQTLEYANEQAAYTLIDRATYVTTKNRIALTVLVEKDPALLNYITLIPVSKKKFPQVKSDLVKAFTDYCTSPEGQDLIRDFGLERYGEALFFPNAQTRLDKPGGEV